jgi:hypothetical protein
MRYDSCIAKESTTTVLSGMMKCANSCVGLAFSEACLIVRVIPFFHIANIINTFISG